MHMWKFEHTVDTSADRGTVFAILADVSAWPRWNAGVESMSLNGPFAAGTTGTMTLPVGDTLAVRLAWFDADWGFQDETVVPGVGVLVRVRHELQPLPPGGT
jgi:hypothetical protein